MLKLNLEAPWYTFRKKVNALFERDPDIRVGEVYKPEDGSTDYAFDLEVKNHEKFLALDRVLPKVQNFGNITLRIVLFDEENSLGEDDRVELYRTIFEGNGIVEDVVDTMDFAGIRHGFVCFKPQVVQFFDDDTSDLNGNWSGLAMDIAREIFEKECPGIHFCTAALPEEK